MFSHPTFWRSIIILFSNLRLGLPSGLFPSYFPSLKPCIRLSSPHNFYIPLPFPCSRLPTRIIFDEQFRSLSSSLCSFLYSPFTSSPLGPNTLGCTLFSNTLSLCSSLKDSDQVNTHITALLLLLLLLLFLSSSSSSSTINYYGNGWRKITIFPRASNWLFRL